MERGKGGREEEREGRRKGGKKPVLKYVFPFKSAGILNLC